MQSGSNIPIFQDNIPPLCAGSMRIRQYIFSKCLQIYSKQQDLTSGKDGNFDPLIVVRNYGFRHPYVRVHLKFECLNFLFFSSLFCFDFKLKSLVMELNRSVIVL